MCFFFFVFFVVAKRKCSRMVFFLVNGLPNADVMPGGIRHPELQIYRAPSIHVIHSAATRCRCYCRCCCCRAISSIHSKLVLMLRMRSLPAAARTRASDAVAATIRPCASLPVHVQPNFLLLLLSSSSSFAPPTQNIPSPNLDRALLPTYTHTHTRPAVFVRCHGAPTRQTSRLPWRLRAGRITSVSNWQKVLASPPPPSLLTPTGQLGRWIAGTDNSPRWLLDPFPAQWTKRRRSTDGRGEKHQRPRDGEKMLLSSTAGEKKNRIGGEGRRRGLNKHRLVLRRL